MRAGALASICVRAGGSCLTGVRCAHGCSCCATMMFEQKALVTSRATEEGEGGGRERVRWVTEPGFKVTGNSKSIKALC